MTGWIIFGSIVLVLALLLIQSARVIIVYDKNPDLPMIEAKFLFFTVYRYPAPPKKKRAKKPKKARAKKAEKNASQTPPADTAESPCGGDEEDEGDPFFAEQDEPGGKKPEKPKKEKKKGGKSFDLEMIVDYVRSAAPPIKRLFKKIRVRDLYIDWVTASDDAAKTALKYGAICASVYSTTKFLTTYFDVKPKEINIEADFSAEKDDIFAYCEVKLRLCTAIACALWLLIRVVKTYLKYNKTAGKCASPKKQKA